MDLKLDDVLTGLGSRRVEADDERLVEDVSADRVAKATEAGAAWFRQRRRQRKESCGRIGS